MQRANFEPLAMEHLDAVYRMAFHLARQADLAADLVQETYLRALRESHRFEVRDFGVRQWLLHILHKVFYTTVPNQTELDCSVTQSQFPEQDPEFVNVLDKAIFSGLPAGRPAGRPIEVTFSYDLNERMHCTFRDVESGMQHEAQPPQTPPHRGTSSGRSECVHVVHSHEQRLGPLRHGDGPAFAFVVVNQLLFWTEAYRCKARGL